MSMRPRATLPWAGYAAAMLLAAAPARGQAPAPRVLVMPFETGRDPRVWWLGEGASVLLAEQLRARGGEAISRDERVEAFARLQVPPVPSLSHGTVIRVGQLLGATTVVIGSLALEEDATLAVRARSIRLDTGRLEGEIEERGRLPDLFAIFDRVAGRVLPAAPGARPVSPDAETALTPPAFENYIKGLLAETPGQQVSFLQKALELAPHYDRARLALWRVLTDQGAHDRALAAALSVAPGSALRPRAMFAAALSELALKRYDDAFNRLKALADDTASAPVYNNLGVVQLQRGSTAQSGKATYWFSKATQANTADEDYFFNLGYAYWLDQDVNASAYWLREAVRRAPDDADAHYVLGWALQVSGSSAESERELELARRLSARYETADRKVGVPRALERVKRQLEPPAARTESVLATAEQRDQRDLASFHLDRGRRFFERESDREAIVELKRALYLSPYLAEAHLLLGKTYLRDGRTREAIDALKIAVWSEETAESHLALAEAYLHAREHDAARREVDRALALDPDSGAGHELLRQLESSR
jgi:tetratricopeptide (TPR) repeat protein